MFKFLSVVAYAGAMYLAFKMQSPWLWPLLYILTVFALYKAGPKEKPGRLFATRGELVPSALVALLLPVALILAWPAVILFLVFHESLEEVMGSDPRKQQ